MTDTKANLELVAPRPLTPNDISHLRNMFELQLSIQSEEDEEDASDLIDYALDMIGRGKNVGSVVEELEFMQYTICPPPSSQKIGKCLASFLREITHELSTGKSKVDLSTKAASRKPSREMHQTLLQGSISAAQRSKMGIYNERGELVKQWAGVKGSEDIDPEERRHEYFMGLEDDKVRRQVMQKRELLQQQQMEMELDQGGGQQSSGEMNLSALASSHRPYAEIEALQTTAEERRGIKQKIYNQHGELNSWSSKPLEDNEDEERRGNNKEMDLSTQGNLKKKAAELEALRATGAGRRGVKNRIYDESGQLNAWNKLKKTESDVSEGPSSLGGGGGVEDGVYGSGSREPSQGSAVSEAEEKSIEQRKKELDNRRRKEFEGVMRDRSLSREEKSKKIAELKARYAQLVAELIGTPTLPPTTPQDMNGNPTDGGAGEGVKLSATDAASKHHNELTSLRNRMLQGSVSSTHTQRRALYNSRGEIVSGADSKFKGIQHSHNPDMDLSASGYQRKKSQELDSIRATGQNRRGVKDKIYDSSGRLNAWKSLRQEEEEEEEREMDLTAKGMEMKKAREIESLRASGNQRTFTMYDENGNIVSASNNDGEQDRHNPEMDLSATGMRLKKAREMEALRKSSNPQGLKQKMYDEQGNLMAWTNNKGEQDNSLNPEMDLSAEGMKLKKAREMEAIRARANPRGLKEKMYDEHGNLVGCARNDGEQNRHNPDMDLSAEGMRLKKAREMEALRAKGRQLKEGVKKQMYDESGQLNAWNNLKDNEAEFRPASLPSNMDLTPEGMKLKKAREIQSLKSSFRKSDMYDADGNIIGASNNDGEQDRHNPDMDLSAEGMKLKKAREMEAIRARANPRGLKEKMYDEHGNLVAWTNNSGVQDSHNNDMDVSAEGMARRKSMELEAIRSGSVDHKETVRPRELTEDELDNLRTMLKSELKIPNESYEEDASDLLDYAMDMIEEGKTVGHVCEELVFLELEVFTADMSDSFGKALSSYLLGLDGELTLARRSKTAMYDENGRIIEKKDDESKKEEEPRIDLSTLAAALKPAKEMKETLLSGSVSAKERSKHDIYDENGVLIKQWDADSDDDKDEAAVHGINLSAGAAAKRASREVDSLLVKKKTGGGVGDRLSKYKEFVKPRGKLHHEGDDHDEERMNALDLSAQAFARKPSREVGAILSKGANSAKERNKQKNYDANGVLIKQWSKVEKDNIDDIDAYIDYQRKLYFEQLEDEEILKDRIAKRDQMLADQENADEGKGNCGPELKLSAQALARKASEEVKALQGISNPKGAKKEIYDENGVLIKQWAAVYEDDTGEDSVEKSLDAQRREDLQAVMMDRSLSKEERAELIEQIKAKYANLPAPSQGSGQKKASELVPVNSANDEQRRKEFEAIMRDRTLSKEDRKLRIEELKKKYSTSTATNQNEQAASAEKSADEDKGLDLSALAFARKASAEVRATLLSGPSAKERSKQGIYDENGVLIKQWANIAAEDDEEEEEDSAEPSTFKAFMSKSVDEQRREELQAIMRDRSLSKDERAQRIEEVKARYAAAAAANQDVLPQSSGSATQKAPPSNRHGKSARLDDQRRKELQSIMKNRSLDRETKNKLLEEVKMKYDSLEASQHGSIETDEEKSEDVVDEPIDLSAASFSQKHLKELEAIKEETAKGKSLKDRMSTFNNDTTVYYDSVAFAVSQNKSESARQIAKRETAESAKKYNYSYGDGGVVDETSAEFKAMGDDEKAAKESAKESAKKYRYRLAAEDQPVINCDPLAFAVKNNKSAAARKSIQRDTKESSKYYNYKYTG